jgi:hypothetical protein
VLKPLKARVVASAPRVPPMPPPAGDASLLLAKLSAGIDELFDADLSRALASAPRTATAPEGDREFDDMPTDDRRPRSSSDRRVALLARYALVEEGDYFEILGVSRDASPVDVQRAHESHRGGARARRARSGPRVRAGREAGRDSRGRGRGGARARRREAAGRVTSSTFREDVKR